MCYRGRCQNKDTCLLCEHGQLCQDGYCFDTCSDGVRACAGGYDCVRGVCVERHGGGAVDRLTHLINGAEVHAAALGKHDEIDVLHPVHHNAHDVANVLHPILDPHDDHKLLAPVQHNTHGHANRETIHPVLHHDSLEGHGHHHPHDHHVHHHEPHHEGHHEPHLVHDPLLKSHAVHDPLHDPHHHHHQEDHHDDLHHHQEPHHRHHGQTSFATVACTDYSGCLNGKVCINGNCVHPAYHGNGGKKYCDLLGNGCPVGQICKFGTCIRRGSHVGKR